MPPAFAMIRFSLPFAIATPAPLRWLPLRHYAATDAGFHFAIAFAFAADYAAAIYAFITLLITLLFRRIVFDTPLLIRR